MSPYVTYEPVGFEELPFVLCVRENVVSCDVHDNVHASALRHIESREQTWDSWASWRVSALFLLAQTLCSVLNVGTSCVLLSSSPCSSCFNAKPVHCGELTLLSKSHRKRGSSQQTDAMTEKVLEREEQRNSYDSNCSRCRSCSLHFVSARETKKEDWGKQKLVGCIRRHWGKQPNPFVLHSIQSIQSVGMQRKDDGLKALYAQKNATVLDWAQLQSWYYRLKATVNVSNFIELKFRVQSFDWAQR